MLVLLFMLFRGEYRVNWIDVVKTVTLDCSKSRARDMNLRKATVSSASLYVLLYNSLLMYSHVHMLISKYNRKVASRTCIKQV